MSKRLTKRDKIDRAKESAPNVPPITCPKIDFVIDILDELPIESDLTIAQVELIKNTMEYIRFSNDALRESSLYWYLRYKETV